MIPHINSTENMSLFKTYFHVLNVRGFFLTNIFIFLNACLLSKTGTLTVKQCLYIIVISIKYNCIVQTIMSFLQVNFCFGCK